MIPFHEEDLRNVIDEKYIIYHRTGSQPARIYHEWYFLAPGKHWYPQYRSEYYSVYDCYLHASDADDNQTAEILKASGNYAA